MLARVADKQYLVVGSDAVQKLPYLPGAGQTRFIDHVKMPARGIVLLAAAAGEKALQSVGGNARIAELLGSARGRGEALDCIAALFGALPDGFEGRGLAGACDTLHALHLIVGGQHLLDGPALRGVQMRTRVGQRRGLLSGHHFRRPVLSLSHPANDLVLGKNHFPRRELAACTVKMLSRQRKRRVSAQTDI